MFPIADQLLQALPLSAEFDATTIRTSTGDTIPSRHDTEKGDVVKVKMEARRMARCPVTGVEVVLLRQQRRILV